MEQVSIPLKVMEGGAVGYPIYEGEYLVVPQIVDQLLETKKKVMKGDVKVAEIPYSSVDNDAGGQTLTIGG